MRTILPAVLSLVLTVSAFAKVENLAKEPYIGAIVVDASTGNVLFADKADQKGYPASVLKLMTMLVVIEKIDEGRIQPTDFVKVTTEAAKTGGSQVYLDPREQFTVDDLLYALMVQSANDAAVALAIHIAGSKDGFVTLMNEKARALGMNATRFTTVHGLPPSTGQDPDTTTARDLSLLCLELLKHPKVFDYTSTKTRTFRQEPLFEMQNHNKLLWSFEGCDGFKTGFFNAAGFSIAATAKRGGNRVIVVVLGSANRKVRDAKAAELLTRGFLILPPKAEPVVAPPPPPPPVQTAVEATPVGAEDVASDEAPSGESGGGVHLAWVIVGVAVGAVAAGGATFWLLRRNADKADYVKRA